MNRVYVSQYYTIFLLTFLLTAACDQSKKPAPAVENIDSASVKRLTTDSSSNMPVAAPKDSTERIPNPYDTQKK